MATHTIHQYHPSTLAQAPIRAFEFLRGVRDTEVRDALTSVGFTDDDLSYGWTALNAALAVLCKPSDNGQTTADRVYAWFGPAYELAHASLVVRFPEQAAYVFANLDVGPKLTVFGNARLFLDRLAALERSNDRKATRKEDHAALATLEARGVTAAIRKEMSGLIEVATTKLQVSPGNVDNTEALVKVHEWVTEWSGIARTVIRKRRLLVKLGVVRPRGAKSKEAPATPVAPAPPALPPKPALVPATPPVVAPAPPPVAAPVATPPVAPVMAMATVVADEEPPRSRAA